MFERETRREKLLQARKKEMRLNEKRKSILALETSSGAGLVDAFNVLKKKNNQDDEEAREEDFIQKAERDLFEIIIKVICHRDFCGTYA